MEREGKKQGRKNYLDIVTKLFDLVLSEPYLVHIAISCQYNILN